MPVFRHLSMSAPVAAALLATAVAAGTAEQRQRQSALPTAPDDRTIVHTLNRIGFGPAPGDIERVRQVGLGAYIDQQLHPERIADTAMAQRLEGFTTLTMSTRELAEKYYIPALMEQRERQRAQQQQPQQPNPDMAMPPGTAAAPRRGDAQREQRQVFAELGEQKILRAIYSERQLEEVMVDFWFNHFNVFAGKGPTRLYLTEYERDVIRPRALGRFRDLLGATAKSPAMLFYLDNWQSTAPEGTKTSAPEMPERRGQRGRPGIRTPQIGRRPQVMLPRPQQPNPQQNPQNRRARGVNENYARELMELHTLGVDGGYTQKDVQEVARAFTGWTIVQPRAGGEFRFEPRMHDDSEKIVLGQRIQSGGGMKDGEQILDMLARHPSTAKFIATKLARRFVADEPPAALVSRAAAKFTATDGDIREVVRLIVTSPEFFAPASYRAKVKTPLDFVASAVRAAGVNLPTAAPVMQALRELGMPLYMCQPPTGYADVAEAWVNTGALLNRMNFAVTLTTPRRPRANANANAPVSADTIVRSVLAGDVSESTRATLAKATDAPKAVALVLGSPEFQKR
jgi:uncharacterized protein (DUF1800 family)